MNFENILNLIIIALSAVLLLLILITIKKKKVSYTEKKTTVVNTATVKLDKTQFNKLEKNTQAFLTWTNAFLVLIIFVPLTLSYIYIMHKISSVEQTLETSLELLTSNLTCLILLPGTISLVFLIRRRK